MREQEEGKRPPQSPAPCAESTSHSTTLHPGPAPLHPGPAPLHPGPAPPPPPHFRVPQVGQLCGRTPSVSDPQPLPRSGLGGDGAISPCGTSSPAPPAGGQLGQFTSSFSFIRLSLTSEPGADRAPPSPPQPAPPEQPVVTAVTDKPASGRGDPTVTPEPKDPQWDSDCCSLSDSASASSLTSGYESAAPLAAGEPWDALLRGYEGVLQECLNSSRRNAQVSRPNAQVRPALTGHMVRVRLCCTEGPVFC